MAKKDLKKNKGNRSFFKDFKAELKKVIWPTPKQLLNNTMIVISIVLLTALIVFVLDFTFDKINTYGIDKMKNLIDSVETSDEEMENEIEENIISDENTVNNEETENNLDTENAVND